MLKIAKTTLLLLIIIVASIAFLQTIIPSTEAQLAAQQPVSGPLPAGVTPSLSIKVKAYLSFRPNPIGVGQTFIVNMWTTPGLNVERLHPDYTVTITKPDGTKDTIVLDSYCADATAWFEYVASQVGTWKLKFDFLGTYFPAGQYYDGNVVTSTSGNWLDSAYYMPDSTSEQELIVQQEQVFSWPPSPLPTDYWTRPVHVENREWWSILGNYPAYGIVGGGSNWPADTNTYMSNYWFTPYVPAPNTAHIVWKRQGAIAGILGGTGGIYSLTGNTGNPNVIYAGRAYQTYTKAGVGSVAACYDLRTGQIYYEKPTTEGGITPEFISYSKSSGVAVPGATESGSYSVSLLSIGSRLIKIDPYSGAVTLNVTGMTPAQFNGGPGAYFGSFHNDPYVLSMQTLGTGAKAINCLINWTTAGTESNFTRRIVSNITLPWGNRIFPNNSTRTPAIVCDFEAGIIANMFEVQPAGMGAYYGTTMMAASLKTGQLLWNITVEDTRYSSACLIADHGKVALLADNGYWVAWDLNSGQQVWKSELMDYPWSEPSFGAYSVQSAYGLLYREAYDGVYAFDWDTGKIVWKYKAPANAYETNYVDETGKNVYSFNAGGLIADGKFFTYNTEHSPTQPITRGWQLHCVNATTGEGIWNITGSLNPGAIADGYLAASGSYDGYMYVFGKGKSATTVDGPKTAIPLGQSLVITGTVLDQSSGQPGTPCVSKDSMTTQMEYLHMQLPIDGLWHNLTMTGVPVVLTAIDQNGDPTSIGIATTNAYYGTFSKSWTPTKEGTYEIIASFAGDDSYGSSGASTAVLVGIAEQQIVIPEQIVPPDYTILIVGVGIAVIIAVVIAAAVVGILVRKK